MCKNAKKERVAEGEGARESEGKKKPPQHWQSKKKKRWQKTGVLFARGGTMLITLYIYI